MHDGQNLFDPATAFAGVDWGLSTTAEQLIASRAIQPLIIVGIYNTGAARMAEYTPVKDAQGRGGKARAYGKLIVEELKPFIDAEYRTMPDASNTGLGGSSLGGLVSLYLGLRHPEIFGKLIVMSPSLWWANRAIFKEVTKLRRATGQKIWLDIGTREEKDWKTTVENARALRDSLAAKGWALEKDLAFLEVEGAGHNEQAWGARIGQALSFLFPPPLRPLA
jgi:predicted alpha/beta superfamily hydrolase